MVGPPGVTMTATLDDGSVLPAWIIFDTKTNELIISATGADEGSVVVKVVATIEGT